jgi:ABC-type oligopeptide transport system substrate-binding subunit
MNASRITKALAALALGALLLAACGGEDLAEQTEDNDPALEATWNIVSIDDEETDEDYWIAFEGAIMERVYDCTYEGIYETADGEMDVLITFVRGSACTNLQNDRETWSYGIVGNTLTIVDDDVTYVYEKEE